MAELGHTPRNANSPRHPFSDYLAEFGMKLLLLFLEVTQAPSELQTQPHSPTPSSPQIVTRKPLAAPSPESDTGPLRPVAQLFPEIAEPKDEDEDEEELGYRERRLKERREILIEKERLAAEEKDLRRLRAKKKGSGGAGPSGWSG